MDWEFPKTSSSPRNGTAGGRGRRSNGGILLRPALSRGFGLAKDPVEALKWLRLAAQQGQIDATAAVKAAETE